MHLLPILTPVAVASGFLVSAFASAIVISGIVLAVNLSDDEPDFASDHVSLVQQTLDSGSPVCRQQVMDHRAKIQNDADWWTDFDAVQLMNCYLDQNDYESLETVATEFIKTGPSTPVSYHYLSYAQASLGHYDQAARTLETAFDLGIDKQADDTIPDLQVSSLMHNNYAYTLLYQDHPPFNTIRHHYAIALEAIPNSCSFNHTVLAAEFQRYLYMSHDAARDSFNRYLTIRPGFQSCIDQYEQELLANSNHQRPLSLGDDLVVQAEETVSVALMDHWLSPSRGSQATTHQIARSIHFARDVIRSIGPEQFCSDAIPSTDRNMHQECETWISRFLPQQ